MPRIHVNPETLESGTCKAKSDNSCKFVQQGMDNVQHFDNKEAANRYILAASADGQEVVSTVSKKKSKNRNYQKNLAAIKIQKEEMEKSREEQRKLYESINNQLQEQKEKYQNARRETRKNIVNIVKTGGVDVLKDVELSKLVYSGMLTQNSDDVDIDGVVREQLKGNLYGNIGYDDWMSTGNDLNTLEYENAVPNMRIGIKRGEKFKGTASVKSIRDIDEIHKTQLKINPMSRIVVGSDYSYEIKTIKYDEKTDKYAYSTYSDGLEGAKYFDSLKDVFQHIEKDHPYGETDEYAAAHPKRNTMFDDEDNSDYWTSGNDFDENF